MKRYGNIFQNIHALSNIELAHKKARKGKAHYSDVKMINNNPEKLRDISRYLRTGVYSTSLYNIETINDRGKERQIFILPYFPDRIVQWAIMLQIQDIFLRTFIYDTYASIPKRGIHKAVKRVNKAIINGGEYCLKIDIKKYFPSIQQKILCNQLERKIKDYRLLDLLFEIIYSIETGLPIGNYLSQWLANFHLAFFDHKVCNQFHLPYFRYMDDIVIFSDSKEQLWDVLSFMRKELDKLQLQVKENYQVFPSKIRGVDFLGYRCFGDYTLLRKKIANNIKRKIKTIKGKPTEAQINSMMSYKGWVQHCNSYRFHQKYINQFVEVKNESRKNRTTRCNPDSHHRQECQSMAA
jgi:retron-type reverse transcriptase